MGIVPNKHGAAILFVEDRPEIGEPVVAALEAQGHHVQVVADAQAGADLLRQGVPVDLLLVDLHVRGGGAVCKLIRTVCLDYPELPIVITKVNRAADRHPGVIVLRRPFQTDILLAAVAAAVAERR